MTKKDKSIIDRVDSLIEKSKKLTREIEAKNKNYNVDDFLEFEWKHLD